MLLVPQKIIHEERNPISHALQKLYNPFFRGAIRFRWVVLILAMAVHGIGRLAVHAAWQRVHAAAG